MKRLYIISIFVIIFSIYHNTFASSDTINGLLGKDDAVLIGNSAGGIIYQKNIHTKLIPASALKVLTSIAAIHYLGEDFRFKTDFYINDDGDLKIKGYGDPFLISEYIENAAKIITEKVDRINDIVLDATYFKPVVINGNNKSFRCYESLNGALCANFNSIAFKSKNGSYVSAEAQTPLLPFVMDRIIASNIDNGRISLTPDHDRNTIYFGKLFGFFLKKHHCDIKGKVRLGRIDNTRDRLIYRSYSDYSLSRIIEYMLFYSNNYIANQLIMALGAKIYGAPADMEKGTGAIYEYIGTKGLTIEEGSGLSRGNKISAETMYKILLKFSPYHKLMKKQGYDYHKTGTLNGIRARVGYLKKRNGMFPYVIILNDNWENIYKVIKAVRDYGSK